MWYKQFDELKSLKNSFNFMLAGDRLKDAFEGMSSNAAVNSCAYRCGDVSMDIKHCSIVLDGISVDLVSTAGNCYERLDNRIMTYDSVQGIKVKTSSPSAHVTTRINIPLNSRNYDRLISDIIESQKLCRAIAQNNIDPYPTTDTSEGEFRKEFMGGSSGFLARYGSASMKSVLKPLDLNIRLMERYL
jgi:hypothetical protein